MLLIKHLREWLSSAVSEELARLNVQSIDGSMGQLSPKYLLLRDDPNAALQNRSFSSAKRYQVYNQFDEFGGWIVWGEDDYFQFKPEHPRLDHLKGKSIKYESPRKVEPTCFKLKVPQRIQENILSNLWTLSDIGRDEFNASLVDLDKDFWEFVEANPQLPTIITEGAKKAGALLTAGFIAIALPGITMGVRSRRNGVSVPRHLIPHLENLAVKGREFVICFDQDLKPKTVANVNKAIITLGVTLSQKGCRVSVTRWDGRLGKGVDDLIAHHGEEAFYEVFLERQEFSQWQQAQVLDLSPHISLQINQRYLNEIQLNPAAKIIGIKSAKGTGKTQWLAAQINQATSQGRRVLVLTHRVQLGQALCDIFGIDYVSEYRNSETKGIFGYGLCVDSLHANSQARFNPDDWEDAYIIIDEIEQVLWHTFESSTCQSERSQILDNLKTVLQIAVSTGGKVFASDADLSPISLEFLQEVLGGNIPMWVLENTYKPVTERTCYVYDGKSPTALFNELDYAIASGQKVYISVASQKAKSLWSTQSLEKYFSNKYPDKLVLRIDSETVANPTHRANGCIAHLEHLLPKFDIVISSNVIETGVSIEGNHFDSVWGIDHGISTVDSFLQRLERVRSDIPRHIWVAERGFNFVGNGAVNAYQLRQSTDKVTCANIALLRQSDDDKLEVDINFRASEQAWAKRGSVVNAGMWNYRESIVAKLHEEGYQIKQKSQLDSELSKAIQDVLKNVRNGNYEAFKQRVVNAEDVTSESEYQELKLKRSKTDSEIAKQRKAEIKRRYCVDEVTAELIERDDNGWYGELRLHYFFEKGQSHLPKRDRTSLDSLCASTGKAFSPDVTKRLLGIKVNALKKLNIKQFFDESATFTNESLNDWFEMVLSCQHQLKDLKISVSPSSSPIKTANRFLKLMGYPYKLTCIDRKKRSEGARRVYQSIKNDDEREFIFEKWLERDSSRDSKVEASAASCATFAPDIETSTPETMSQPVNLETAKDSDSSKCSNFAPDVPNNIYIEQNTGANLQKNKLSSEEAEWIEFLEKERLAKEQSPEVKDVAVWLGSCPNAETLGEYLKIFASDVAVFSQDVINRAWGLIKEHKRRLLRQWWVNALGGGLTNG